MRVVRCRRVTPSLSSSAVTLRLTVDLFYESRSPTREGLVDNIVVDYLFGLLQSGADADAWSTDDARSTAVFLFSGLHGVVDDAYTRAKPVNRTRLAPRLEHLCFKAVGL